MALRWFAIAALSGAAIVGTSGILYAQSGAMTSVWSGVYTSAQADRGRNIYMQNCVKCHGTALEGMDEIPQLSGSHFMADWETQSIADLVQRIHNTMPMDNPGTISNSSATDIVSFLLQSNGVPAGTTELPNDASMQSQIRIDPVKPGQ